MDKVKLVTTQTWEDKWNELDDMSKAEHKLSNSELYQYYTRSKELEKRVDTMNLHVEEQYRVKLPTMYYIEELTQKDK